MSEKKKIHEHVLEKFSSIKSSLFSQHIQSSSTRNAHKILQKQHSTKHELLNKGSKSKGDSAVEQYQETGHVECRQNHRLQLGDAWNEQCDDCGEHLANASKGHFCQPCNYVRCEPCAEIMKKHLDEQYPLKYATQDKSEGDDKNTYETDDTVTFVTVCHGTVAWGSKKGNEYGVFICDYHDDEVHLEKASFFPTKDNQLVQSLDFNASSESFEMVGVDFGKHLYLFSKKGFEEGEEQKGEIEDDGEWKKVYAEDLPDFNGHPTSINFKRTVFDAVGLIAIGSDADEVYLYSLDSENDLKPQPIVLLEEKKKEKEGNQKNILKRAGKVLDVEFVRKDTDLTKDIEIVVADASGELTVYCLSYKGKNQYEFLVTFTTVYNLNVESGCMISCADEGEHIAVGCGDHIARVLKRITHSTNTTGTESHAHTRAESITDLSIVGVDENHDYWEEYAKFEVDHQILSVDLSGDGDRLAIATEAKVALVYDTKHGGCQLNSYASGGRVRSVCLDLDGSHLLVGGFDKKVVYYDNTSGFKPTLALTVENTVQSVSIDRDGKKLAVGITSGEANVYSIDSREQLYSYTTTDKKLVYVVKLSTDGNFLAIGDYNNTVTVVDLEKKEKIFELGEEQGLTFFIWGLDFIVTGEPSNPKYRLAVGCWNKYALVYDFQKDDPTPTIVTKVQRKDRVFDVCLSADGEYLLVGGRDQAAALYYVTPTEEHPHGEPLFETDYGERVYCVALNPKATRLALGGITKTVKVYEHKNKHPWGLTRTYEHGHTIHRMEFLDKEILAAISEDGKCVIYNVTSQAPILQLTYGDAGNSLALSEFGMLAVAHGHHVTVYGKGSSGYGIADRPSLELATEMMDDPASLKIALNTYPSLANAYDKDNTTLLYKAVEKDKEDIVQCLLEARCTVGLLMQDKSKLNPLMLALQRQNKGIVGILLSAITNERGSNAVVNTSALFESLFAKMTIKVEDEVEKFREMTPFEMLGKQFPDLLLRFLSKLKLVPCEDQVLGEQKYMTLHEPLYIGLACKAPQHFWQKYYEEYKKSDDAFLQTNTPFLVQAYRMPIPGLCGDPTQQGNNTKKDKKGKQSTKVGQKQPLKNSPKPSYQKHITDMGRLPSTPDVLHYKHSEGDFQSPLEIIVDAARRQQDYNVFKDHTVVYTLVQYKWKVLRTMFIFQYFLFLGYLFLCAWLSMTLSNYVDEITPDDTGTQTPTAAPTVAPDTTDVELAWYAYPLSILLGLRSLFYLYHEGKQLYYEYRSMIHPDHRHKKFHKSFSPVIMLKAIRAYISDDVWNLLDVSSFVTQLLTDVCVWTKWSSMLGFASVSILLLFGKIFFYARGFEQWGPFVRMIQRTMQDMKSFLLVMLVFFLAFAVALDVILGGEDGFTDLYQSFFSVTLIVYGEFDSILDIDDGWTLATILFETYLLVVVIILLNLLVAIMSESFADVKENAANETTFELASIIVELEKMNQGTIGQDKLHTLFPRWVHVLKPANEDFEESTVDLDERMDSIEKVAGQMDGKIDSLASSLKRIQNELRQFHKAEVDHD